MAAVHSMNPLSTNAPTTEPVVPPRDANFYADTQYLLNRGNRTCVRSAATNVPLMKRRDVSQRNVMLKGKTHDSRMCYVVLGDICVRNHLTAI